MTVDQLTNCKGCTMLPVGAVRDGRALQPAGRQEQHPPERRVIADMYLGKISKWNDAAHPEAQPGCQPSRHRHHAGLPQRRLGHDVQLHRLPLGVEQDVREPDRPQHRGRLAEGRRRPRQLGCLRRAHPHARRGRLRRHRVRAREQAPVRGRPEQVGEVRAAGHPRDQGSRPGRPEFDSRNFLSIVNPPKGAKYATAYPICTYTYVILPLQSSKGAALKAFVNWAITGGQALRRQAPVRPAPGLRGREGQGNPQEGLRDLIRVPAA